MCPMPVALLAAAVVGFLVALVVGLSTLRLRGVYFVVFTFGLTELVHQVRQLVGDQDQQDGDAIHFLRRVERDDLSDAAGWSP